MLQPCFSRRSLANIMRQKLKLPSKVVAGELRRRAAVIAGPDALGVSDGDGGADDADDAGHGPDQPPEAGLHRVSAGAAERHGLTLA